MSLFGGLQQERDQRLIKAGNQPKRKRDPQEEAERLSRTIFVGNLVPETQRKSLRKLFSSYGEVETVRLRSVTLHPESKKPRAAAIKAGDLMQGHSLHAYIVFTEAPAAVAALQHNMQLVAGRHIRVDLAAAQGGAAAVKYNPARSVFVGNLGFDVQDESLITFFNARTSDATLQQPVTAVRVVRDAASGVGKGFAFVEFQTKAAALAARDCDGQKLEGRPLRIMRASHATKGGAKAGASAVVLGKSHKAAAGPSSSRPGHKQRPFFAQPDASTPSWQGGKGPKGQGPSRAAKRPAVQARKAKQQAARSRRA
ncbi:hypothetical protein WJX73_005828 [Symbiochloris irregularis]|uniref:RRM domain-containing protein n=1 Tax=Symbiochloris irregularis TaxID=706552 RepID=A0AAW1NZ08_9CHLO